MLMKQSLQDTLVMVQNVHVEDSGGIWKKKQKKKKTANVISKTTARQR